MISIPRDLIIGAILFFLGVFVYAQVSDLAYESSLLPKTYSSLLMICSIAVIVRSYTSGEKITFRFDKNYINKIKEWRVFGYIIILFVYWHLISQLGFLISSLLFISGSYIFSGVYNVKNYLFAIVIVVLVYVVFNEIFGLRLPQGMFF